MDLYRIIRNNGVSITYISKKLNMTRQTFYNRCARFGFSDYEKERMLSILPELSESERDQIKKYKKIKKKV